MSVPNYASAFDGLAQEYDAQFTATTLGTLLRRMSWRHFERVFAQRESLLEIGCGTGEDAIHLASLGHRVLATDASLQMMRVARHKAERAGCAHRIRFLWLPMERLGAELAGERFDGVYSNFGAINCAPSLDALAARAGAAGPGRRAAGLGGHGSLRAVGMGLVPGARRSERRLSPLAPRRRRVARAYACTIRRPRSSRARCSPTSRRAAPRRWAWCCRLVMPLRMLERAPRLLAALARIEARAAAPAHAGGAAPTTTSSKRRGAGMMQGLPLVTLYLTERCNSRCVTCDYWRHGRNDVTLESVQRLLPELESLGTRTALLSGGEPLLNPEWPQIAELLRAAGLQLWLLTSGLSLAKHAQRAAPAVRVDHRVAGRHLRRHLRGHPRPRRIRQGLRGHSRRGRRRRDGRTARHAAARQLPRAAAFRDAGARARREPGFVPGRRRLQSARVRAQRRLHARAGARAATTSPSSTVCWRRSSSGTRRISATASSPNRPRSSGTCATTSPRCAAAATFPPVRCNAPEFSAVVGVDGRVSPCFFIPGPAVTRGPAARRRRSSSPPMVELRARDPRRRARRMRDAACARCSASRPNSPRLQLPRRAHAGL